MEQFIDFIAEEARRSWIDGKQLTAQIMGAEKVMTMLNHIAINIARIVGRLGKNLAREIFL